MIDREHGHPHRWVEAPVVVAWIEERMQRYPAGKMVIYEPTKVQIHMIAEAIGCDAYYRDQADKAGILARFATGETQVITATSALGMGIDIPDIQCVIHLGGHERRSWSSPSPSRRRRGTQSGRHP